jgi:hypothetical protein
MFTRTKPVPLGKEPGTGSPSSPRANRRQCVPDGSRSHHPRDKRNPTFPAVFWSRQISRGARHRTFDPAAAAENDGVSVSLTSPMPMSGVHFHSFICRSNLKIAGLGARDERSNDASACRQHLCGRDRTGSMGGSARDNQRHPSRCLDLAGPPESRLGRAELDDVPNAVGDRRALCPRFFATRTPRLHPPFA